MDSKQIQKAYQQVNEYQKRVHRVFSTDDGKELLRLWKQHILMEPINNLGADLFNLGRAEGRNQFVRDLITAMNMAEGKYGNDNRA